MGAPRQFRPQPTRSGGMVRLRFALRCSRCGSEHELDSVKNLPDSSVARKFSDGGWVLGRNRSNDICPDCLGVKSENRLPTTFKVTNNRAPEQSSGRAESDFIGEEDLLVQFFRLQSDNSSVAEDEETGLPIGEDPIERKIAKEVEAKPVEVPTKTVVKNDDPVERLETDVDTHSLERKVDAMAADISQMRAASELMVELLSSVVQKEGELSEAIGRLAALIEKGNTHMAQSVSGMSISLDRLSSSFENDRPNFEKMIEGMTDITRRLSEASQPVTQAQVTEWAVATPPVQESPSQAVYEAPEPIVEEDEPSGVMVPVQFTVKSSPANEKKTRFVTLIGMPIEVWKKTDFKEDDKFLYDWDGKTLAITRAPIGHGARLKYINEKTALFQASNKVGNLNFETKSVEIFPGEVVIYPK